MRKLMSYAGIATLAISMTLGLFFTTSSAESTSVPTNEINTADNSPQAFTKYVYKTKEYYSHETVASSILYDDGTYRGNIHLDRVTYYGNIKVGYYSGTVTCYSNCPIPPAAKE